MKPSKLQQIKRQFGIIGNAPVLHHAIEVAIRVAGTNMSVLITGENGSGKESFAKLIHDMSLRKHGKFIPINCGAIPEGTIDSELFGHEKGSFTSAAETRKGHFEEADRGTIFLDEIGEMPLHTQPRLLRVLENQEYMRVGSSQKRSANIRVVAATNISLPRYVAQKKFREDLYYRIAQVQLHIPPLRERPEDINLLFKKFSLDFAEHHGTSLIQLDTVAQEKLKKFPFPGNVRQLKNITWQLATLEGPGTLITEDILSNYLPKPMMLEPPPSTISPITSLDEQNLLYRELFTMKREIEEIKQLLFDMIQDKDKSMEIIKKHPNFFKLSLSTKSAQFSERDTQIKVLEGNPVVEESLSLKEHEKELIKKAIAQSKSYKIAARKLGIAERTLYRKVQEYKLG